MDAPRYVYESPMTLKFATAQSYWDKLLVQHKNYLKWLLMPGVEQSEKTDTAASITESKNRATHEPVSSYDLGIDLRPAHGRLNFWTSTTD